ncbi:MAG: FAD/NAD(P)-binding protein [Legionellaceae bacterium]|nr:FAD/NAD(P)-binding protein [Legionellaceae bacterium]
MKKIITVIGLGPRGLNIIERLLAVLKNTPSNKTDLTLNIINPGDLGVGVHAINQPQSLLVNTVACQITMYTDASVTNAGPICEGPSFYTWAKQQGYKYNEALRQYGLLTGRDIQPNDYLPRALFGKYLQWVAQSIITELELHCTVNLYQREVVDIQKQSTSNFNLILSDGLSLPSDYVFLTTGHSTNELDPSDTQLLEKTTRLRQHNPNFSFIASPYPIAKATENLGSNISVAIEGFGLTSTDLISELTVGKGGRFIPTQNGRYRYIKSGQEPNLVVYSKSGLPFKGRAANQKGISAQYKPTFFTYDAMKHLKQTFGTGPNQQLDFEVHILPELIKEMAYGYYMTTAKHFLSDDAISIFSQRYIKALDNPKALNQLIDTSFSHIEKFDWNEIMDPTYGRVFQSALEYRHWMLNYLQQDLDDSIEGNVTNPFKAACDILRDIRDIIRYVIDFSGLTEQSHQIFMKKYAPIMNRISVGPPKERIAELIALIESGVVDVFVGKNPQINIDEQHACFQIAGSNILDDETRQVDTVIKARISAPLPQKDSSPLMKNLLRHGLVRIFQNGDYHPSGIDIDRQFHPINATGTAEKSIWCIGTIVEGPKFYTYIVPRPGVNSTCLLDAGKAMLDLFDDMKRNENSLRNRSQASFLSNISNGASLGFVLCFLAIVMGISYLTITQEDRILSNDSLAFN